MMGLPESEKSLMIYFAVSIEYRRVSVTNRQTDRQADILRQHSPRCIASRG